MKVALLALQGDFAEHEAVFRALGAETLQLRQKKDLEQQFDALILPGGESTVQGKLLRELEMFDPLKEMIGQGKPVLATCAGVILLARQLLDDPTVHLGTLNAVVRRNAYGRQLGSFFIRGSFAGIKDVPMSFIRAPQIEFCGSGCEVLAEHEGRITAVRQGNQLAMTFHPELCDDYRVAQYFLSEIVGKN
ncbi:MAG: pyridoxal 5'-phosphate synthase glutaminase subunit PdxT [Lentisphaeria bacterium]|nr:pyridoxal 5'-phosphate synthase glutaminase subunit PdxT [Lentisphaeria bacterium]